jgi:hypothetical protein
MLIEWIVKEKEVKYLITPREVAWQDDKEQMMGLCTNSY